MLIAPLSISFCDLEVWICGMGKTGWAFSKTRAERGKVSCCLIRGTAPGVAGGEPQTLCSWWGHVLPGRVSLSPLGVLSCPTAEFIAAWFLLPTALGRLTTYVPTVSHFVTGGLSLCLSVLAGWGSWDSGLHLTLCVLGPTHHLPHSRYFSSSGIRVEQTRRSWKVMFLLQKWCHSLSK